MKLSPTDAAVLDFHRRLQLAGWVIDREAFPPAEVIAAYKRLYRGKEERAELVLHGSLVDFQRLPREGGS